MAKCLYTAWYPIINKGIIIFLYSPQHKVFDEIKYPEVFHEWCANQIDVIMPI